MKPANWKFREPVRDQSWIVCPVCRVLSPLCSWVATTDGSGAICPNCFDTFKPADHFDTFNGRVEELPVRQPCGCMPPGHDPDCRHFNLFD